jgi:transcriptional regulator with XRE-family HTH domain
MAARLGVKTNTYHKNENGETFPGAKTLNLLQEEFGISMEWFMFGRGPMYYKDILADPAAAIKKEGREELETALKEVSGKLEKFAWLEEAGPEMETLLLEMEKDPQLRFELLAYFYKYKKE